MTEDAAWFALAAAVATIAWAIIFLPAALLISLGPGTADPLGVGEPAMLAAIGYTSWLLIFAGLYRMILRSTRG